jgi:hypothetical protein
VLRKPELLERQKAQRATDPFGGYSAIGWRGLRGADTTGPEAARIIEQDLDHR